MFYPAAIHLFLFSERRLPTAFYLSLSVKFAEMKQKKCTDDEFFPDGWSRSPVALRPVVAFWCQIAAKFAITLPR
jgi:hypothetical protein